MSENTLFQYCQKLVILSSDKQSVLLARRKGEADYNSTYSFIGGKMETTDSSILAGMKREKDEEIGAAAKVKVLPNETYNLLFRKKDGNAMILPHIAGLYVSGDIRLATSTAITNGFPLPSLKSLSLKSITSPSLHSGQCKNCLPLSSISLIYSHSSNGRAQDAKLPTC